VSRRGDRHVRALLVLLVIAAVIAGCGGGDNRREAVDAYIREANLALANFTPAFNRAATVLRRLGGANASATDEQLRDAVSAIRRARSALDRIEPPAEARHMHADLLRLLEVQAEVTEELRLVTTYLPRAKRALLPSRAAATELNRRLRQAHEPAAQVAALQNYAAAVATSLRRFEALEPPAVLRPGHDGEADRLRASRRLTLALAGAIDAGDVATINATMQNLRSELSAGDAVTAAQQAAVRTFNARIEEQDRLADRILRQQRQLDQSLR
jgi:hypothetical protein